MPNGVPTNAPRTAPSAGRPLWQRMLGVALLVGAALFLAHGIRNQAPALTEVASRLGAWQLMAAAVAAAVMCILKAAYHRNVLTRISGREPQGRGVMLAYAQAQLVRYLPGKIWGLVHQANHLSAHYRASEIVMGNTLQMIATNLLAVGVTFSILGTALLESAWPLLGLPASIIALELLHRYPLLDRFLLRIAQRVARAPAAERMLDVAGVKWLGTALLTAEWLAYYGMWLLLSNGMLSVPQALVLGTWYAAASLVSILAIAVPAGLVVREAIFVSMAGIGHFPQSMLLMLAALLRVITVAGDVLCAVAISVADKFRGGGHG